MSEAQNQAALDHERLELLDLLLEAGADGFLDWQLDDCSIVYSSRLKMILGYEDEPFPVTPWAWLELTHPQDRPMVAKALEDLIGGTWPFDMIFRMKHRVAGWRWMRARAVARRDATGNATRLVAVFSDISAQVRAEKRQVSLLNAVPDLLIRVQNDSTVADVRIPEGNAEWVGQLPATGEKLCGSQFANGWASVAEQALVKAIGERQPQRFEARRSLPPQTGPCDIEVRVFPTTDDESLFVIRDITTDKHQREQGLQSQKLEAIGQLAAGIAHEINTPLQFVGDNVHFLGEAAEAFTSAIRRYRQCFPETLAPALNEVDTDLDIEYFTEQIGPSLAAVRDGVQRVSNIVQAMKSFSHPGTRDKQPEDLNNALETTLTISTSVWKYVAEIERDFAADLPKVDCVIGEVNQVFLNLITNSAHAIGDVVGDSGAKGSIRISTKHDCDCVEIRIADSGRGIPESVQSRIFEPFFTTKAVGKGTGQGLPLARAIVLQHQGSLEFESVEGVGTTFIIRLPVTAVAATRSDSLRAP